MTDRAQRGDLPRPEPRPTAIIVAQGKLLDFVDGMTQRNETHEEYVRQEIAKSLVLEYGYVRAAIAVEFTLRLGSRRPRADLVIFPEGKPQRQDLADIIVECKAPSVKPESRQEGVGQLQSYISACPNVRYGMWTNGSDRFCYRKTITDGVISYKDIADIPRNGQTEDEIERPKFELLMPASSDALLFAFRRCHNYISGNQGLQKPEAFWELLKLIFCKIHDERTSSVVQFYATSIERGSLNGQMKIKARIEKLFKEVREDFSQIFRSGESIELAPEVLAYIVTQLQPYSLLDSDVDVKGKAYEEVTIQAVAGAQGFPVMASRSPARTGAPFLRMVEM